MFSRAHAWHVSCEAFASVIEARYANHFEVGHNDSSSSRFRSSFTSSGSAATAAEPGPQVRIVRIVMGPPFAKSLLETLQRAVHEYEQLHGTIDQG